MKKITLKDYLAILEQYESDINAQINEIFALNIQQFAYDSIKLVDTRVNGNNLFIKLAIINYNNTNKNYLIEVFKQKGQIEHIIYIKRPLGMGIDMEKTRVSSKTILALIELIEKYSDYFKNPCNKKNILSLFKIAEPTDEVLEQIDLDVTRLPIFILSSSERKK